MNSRLMFVLALAASWMFGTVYRLYDLQVRNHEKFSQRAEKQQQRVVKLDPPRGTIYDAAGRELAVSVEVHSVAVDPSRIDDPEATSAALAKVLQIDRQRLAEQMRQDREFVWVARKLDPPKIEAVRELDLDGVILLPESKRYFPLRRLAAHVLGYVGTDNAGLAGLEYLYDRVVASEPGNRTVVRDARFGTVHYPNLEFSEAKPGRDIQLTLDAAIQYVVERELEKAMREHNATRGTVVVMDPNTGAILAMASSPTFDPNRFAEFPKECWRNVAVMDAYEPGSTFKMVTLAAALESGAVQPLDVIDCGRGGITLERTRIHDHHPFDQLTVAQVMAKSSNVGAIRMGLAAGRQRFYDMIEAFGFGRPTGVDLPSESGGILRPLERWYPLSPAYISFGQGMSLTALQLTNAFAAIANDGRLMTPFIVDSIDGVPVPSRPEKPLPIAPSTLRQIKHMLAGVVSEGTAKLAAIPGYHAAGKTGTAQKAVPGGGYSPTKHVASFVGFAPLENPAVVCAVIIDEPWPRYHGGDAAAPVFSAVVRAALLHLGVPPEREKPTLWPAERETAEGSRLVEWEENDTLEVPMEGTVPSFLGLTARDSVRRSSGLGLRVDLHGHGRVEKQKPAAGTPLEVAGDSMELWLEPVRIVREKRSSSLVAKGTRR